jgi:hypothetical protein
VFAAVQLLFGMTQNKTKYLLNLWSTAGSDNLLFRAFSVRHVLAQSRLGQDPEVPSAGRRPDVGASSATNSASCLASFRTSRGPCLRPGFRPARRCASKMGTWTTGTRLFRLSCEAVTAAHAMLIFTHADLTDPPLNLQSGLRCPFCPPSSFTAHSIGSTTWSGPPSRS